MSLFSQPKYVIWPKIDTLSIYSSSRDNNHTPLDFNLWSPLSSDSIVSLQTFFTQNKIRHCTFLIPDDIILTKSFIYDSVIDKIDHSEVISLAESFVPFKINPQFLEYNLIPSNNKTIIQSRIYDSHKYAVFLENIKQLHLADYSIVPISSAVASAVSTFNPAEYFLCYPLNQSESTIILASGKSVYLTATVKNSVTEIQKIINYSNLYFSAPVKKIYLPQSYQAEFGSSQSLDKTEYSDSLIATNLSLPSNIPLPVAGVLVTSSSKVAIIKSSTSSLPTSNMEQKRNILPLVAVFIAATAMASIAIWFVLNQNNGNIIEEPVSDLTPTGFQVPTEVPSPTPTIVANINKKAKIQVLNATSINGQAATFKNALVKLGFTSVTVGNATESATANQLQVKSTFVGASGYFLQNLTGFFDFVEAEELPASSTYDAVFIIGTRLGELPSLNSVSATGSATPGSSSELEE